MNFTFLFLFLTTTTTTTFLCVTGNNRELPPRLREITNNDELGNWEPSDVLKRGFPYYVSGYDDEGRPIFEIGKFNYKVALNGGKEEIRDFLKYHNQAVYRVGKLADAVARDGPGEVVLIFDFDGFSLDNVASKEVIGFALHLMSQFGPLHSKVGYGFFINANYFAEVFLNMLRPYLGTFMEKFEQYGTRKEHWMPRILKKLPPDQLPPQYGGTNQEFEPIISYG